jgi:hypothetical protein
LARALGWRFGPSAPTSGFARAITGVGRAIATLFLLNALRACILRVRPVVTGGCCKKAVAALLVLFVVPIHVGFHHVLSRA